MLILMHLMHCCSFCCLAGSASAAIAAAYCMHRCCSPLPPSFAVCQQPSACLPACLGEGQPNRFCQLFSQCCTSALAF